MTIITTSDIIIIGSDNKTMDQTIKHLDQAFSTKDLGNLHYFFGIEVIQKSDWELFLCQKRYIIDIRKRENMNQAKPLHTPMTSNLRLSSNKVKPSQTRNNTKILLVLCNILQ